MDFSDRDLTEAAGRLLDLFSVRTAHDVGTWISEHWILSALAFCVFVVPPVCDDTVRWIRSRRRPPVDLHPSR